MRRTLGIWLWLTVPTWARAAVRGDLDEEFSRIRRERGTAAARTWYVREAFLIGVRYAGSRWRSAPSAPLRSARTVMTILTDLVRDLRLAARQMRRHPAFAVAAVLTLGIGIGANASIFSLTNAVLLKPLAREDPASVVRIYSVARDGRRSAAWTYADYRRFREPNEGVTQLSAVHMAILSSRFGQTRDQLLGEVANADYFELLGARVVLGRTVTVADDHASATPVALVSERYWRIRFDAKPDVLGTPVILNGRTYTVVGVMEDSFRGSFVGAPVDVWLPLEPSLPFLGTGAEPTPSAPVLGLLARIRPGSSAAQAQQELSTAAADVAPRRGLSDPLGIELVPGTLLHGSRRSMAVTFLGILTMLVGLVLLIAASNVANLMLARAITRQREVAVRLALGAARGRVIREVAAESLLLAVSGGAAGLLLTRWLARTFDAVTLLPGFELRLTLSADWRVVAVTTGLTLIAAFVSTLGPALAATSSDPLPALKEGGGSVGSPRAKKLRASLVVAQVAVASLACVAAGLLVKSGRAAAEVDLGFETSKRFATDVDLTVRGYTEERGRQFYRSLLEKVLAIPGVESAAVANRAPLDSSTPTLRILRPEEDASMVSGRSVGFEATYYTVSDRYFETIALPIVTGSGFGRHHDAQGPQVAVVNGTFAERVWPGVDRAALIGRRFKALSPGAEAGGPARIVEVVGIAGHAKYRTVGEDAQPHVYFPVAQRFTTDLALIVHASTTVMPMLDVQTAIASLDPEVQGFFTRTLEEHTRVALIPARLAATLSGVVGVVSAVLGAIGLYGLIACIVAERRREFGVCLALGATPSTISRQVLLQSLRLAAVGGALGLTAALVVTRLLRALLYGVSPTDPSVYASVIVGVLGIAITASWIPARQAARGATMQALRE